LLGGGGGVREGDMGEDEREGYERRGDAKGREVIRKGRKVTRKGARDAKEERDGEVNGNSREERKG
jgi:hypothetical protein